MKLLLGGSPCTFWSIAQTKSREVEASGQGWELFKNYLIALEKFKPDYFLYENNKSMSSAIREQITKALGVEPICINSALVSAQNRQRLYWTNIPDVQQPIDRNIALRDVLDGFNADSSPITGSKPIRIGTMPSKDGRINNSQSRRIYSIDAKAPSICASTSGGNCDVSSPSTRLYAIPVYQEANYSIIDGASVLVSGGKIRQGDKAGTKQGKYVYTELSEKANTISAGQAHNEKVLSVRPDCGEYKTVYTVRNGSITIGGNEYPIGLSDGDYIIRKLSVDECKRLQTVPDDYEFPVSDTQAYRMLGNGWTVDVIAHILSYCPQIRAEPIDVLSMYDGMACGHIALDKVGGVAINNYYATEIDKYAVRTATHNFPDIIELGDAFQVRDEDWKLPIERGDAAA